MAATLKSIDYNVAMTVILNNNNNNNVILMLISYSRILINRNDGPDPLKLFRLEPPRNLLFFNSNLDTSCQKYSSLTLGLSIVKVSTISIDKF